MKINTFKISTITTAIVLASGSATSYAADASFANAHYTGSGQCAQCHDGLTDSAGNDI